MPARKYNIGDDVDGFKIVDIIRGSHPKRYYFTFWCPVGHEFNKLNTDVYAAVRTVRCSVCAKNRAADRRKLMEKRSRLHAERLQKRREAIELARIDIKCGMTRTNAAIKHGLPLSTPFGALLDADQRAEISRHLSNEDRSQRRASNVNVITPLLESGMPVAEIAKRFRLSRARVYQIRNKYLK